MIPPKGHLVETLNFNHNIDTRTQNRNGFSPQHRIQDDWPEFDLDTPYDRSLSSTARSRYGSHRRDLQFRSASGYEQNYSDLATRYQQQSSSSSEYKVIPQALALSSDGKLVLLPMAYSPPSYVSQSGFEGFQQNRTLTVSPEKVGTKGGDLDEMNMDKLEKLWQYINASPVTRDGNRTSRNELDVTRAEGKVPHEEKDRVTKHLNAEARLKETLPSSTTQATFPSFLDNSHRGFIRNQTGIAYGDDIRPSSLPEVTTENRMNPDTYLEIRPDTIRHTVSFQDDLLHQKSETKRNTSDQFKTKLTTVNQPGLRSNSEPSSRKSSDIERIEADVRSRGLDKDTDKVVMLEESLRDHNSKNHRKISSGRQELEATFSAMNYSKRGGTAQIELEEDIESDKAQDSMSKIEPLRESIIPFSELETFCRPDEKTTTELGYLSEHGQEINREPLPYSDSDNDNQSVTARETSKLKNKARNAPQSPLEDTQIEPGSTKPPITEEMGRDLYNSETANHMQVKNSPLHNKKDSQHSLESELLNSQHNTIPAGQHSPSPEPTSPITSGDNFDTRNLIENKDEHVITAQNPHSVVDSEHLFELFREIENRVILGTNKNQLYCRDARIHQSRQSELIR